MSRNSIHALLCYSALGAAVLAGAQASHAHYIWLKTIDSGGQPKAYLSFGEVAAEEDFEVPAPLDQARLIYRTNADGQPQELKSEAVDTAERIGLVADLPNGKPCVVETCCEYGLYHDSLLVYYAKHVHTNSPADLATAGPSKQLKLDVVPRVAGGDVELTVLWDGKPLAGSEVSLVFDDGEQMSRTTDGRGVVTWQPAETGLANVIARHEDDAAKGQIDGESYEGAAHFTTLTFPWSAARRADNAASLELSEAVASFGAAVADGWLYVYGGHAGTAHDHSSANLSQHFRRVRLSGGEWEELAMQTPLQGLALVAHDGKLYRIGGMNARNATPEDDEDLHSTADFAMYNPAGGKWTALAPLPAPRSSLDAVVIGDKIYVVGGWTLDGSNEGTWPDCSLVFDLADPQTGWQQLPEQSFRCRARAAGQWQDKLVVLGGMNEDGDVSQRVDVFDPATSQWSQGPDLPGTGSMDGFGISAWNLDGRLYFCGSEGMVYGLMDDGSKWEEVAPLETPRFFHRLLPGTDGSLLVVGGATEEGHQTSIERVNPVAASGW